jgi:hypothetical protein
MTAPVSARAGVAESNVIDLASRRTRHHLHAIVVATRRYAAENPERPCLVLPFRPRPALSQQLHGFR